MNSRRFASPCVIFVSLITLSAVERCRGDVVLFTSRPAWEAQRPVAIGTFFEDFERVQVDTQFRTVPHDLGPFVLAQSGSGVFRNFIDVPPFAFSDNNGTRHASLFTDFGSTTVHMSFPHNPVLAWGGDFFGANDSEGLVLTLLATDGMAVATIPVPIDTGFFGFISDEPIGQIVFASRTNIPGLVGEGFGLDNVAGSALPEPSALSLTALGLGSLGVVWFVRRCRATTRLSEPENTDDSLFVE